MNDLEQARMPDAALLIDWENIKSSLSTRGLRPSVAAIRDSCARFGRIVLALTGRTGEYWTLSLEDSHPDVAAARAASHEA